MNERAEEIALTLLDDMDVFIDTGEGWLAMGDSNGRKRLVHLTPTVKSTGKHLVFDDEMQRVHYLANLDINNNYFADSLLDAFDEYIDKNPRAFGDADVESLRTWVADIETGAPGQEDEDVEVSVMVKSEPDTGLITIEVDNEEMRMFLASQIVKFVNHIGDGGLDGRNMGRG